MFVERPLPAMPLDSQTHRLVQRLTKQADLAALLDRFFAHTGAEIEQFQAAVREFQERIPELAKGLLATIEKERASNKAFVAAYAG